MLRDALIGALRPYQFRGKGRMLRRLVPGEGERVAQVFGYRMRLELGEFIQRHIYFGDFERQETRWVRRWLRPGMSFVDVGANVGYFTLLAASRVGPEGRVFACEPSPEAFARLEATLRDNPIPQARAFPFALGAEPGQLHLHFTSHTVSNHTPSMVAQPGARTMPVPVRTLDECLEEWKLPRVDLLKVDVEGFEPQVLAGARQALATGRIRALLCEFNDPWLRLAGSSAAELYALLRGFHYRDVSGAPEPAAGCMENRLLVRAG
jgi:FkbM family methyltransferase